MKKALGIFGLALEAPFRLLVVLGGHFLLNAYSLLSINQKSVDHTAYLQFRLGINAYSPTQEITQDIRALPLA